MNRDRGAGLPGGFAQKRRFPAVRLDEVALAAVNEIETLTTGLSRKIWQKITILKNVEIGG